jgi:hypothetical protein
MHYDGVDASGMHPSCQTSQTFKEQFMAGFQVIFLYYGVLRRW